ncbi:hypothetical protein D018_1521B, partial [Vibrio parahaemolyticus VP2007-007]
LLRFTMHNI